MRPLFVRVGFHLSADALAGLPVRGLRASQFLAGIRYRFPIAKQLVVEHGELGGEDAHLRTAITG